MSGALGGIPVSWHIRQLELLMVHWRSETYMRVCRLLPEAARS